MPLYVCLVRGLAPSRTGRWQQGKPHLPRTAVPLCLGQGARMQQGLQPWGQQWPHLLQALFLENLCPGLPILFPSLNSLTLEQSWQKDLPLPDG